MALFHIMAIDHPDTPERRLDNREAHLAWAKANPNRIKLAGPLLHDDGKTFKGSILLVEGANRTDVETFLKDDPYACADVFERIEITPFKWVIGA